MSPVEWVLVVVPVGVLVVVGLLSARRRIDRRSHEPALDSERAEAMRRIARDIDAGRGAARDVSSRNFF